MATATKTAPNPFASAAKKKAGPAAKARPIYIADDVKAAAGHTLYRADEVAAAIKSYNDADSELKKAEAAQAASRPIIVGWTKAHFTQDWLMGGTRPENPSIMSASDGDQMKVLFIDKAAKLDEFQFSQLVDLVGQDEADANVIRRTEFTINPELLEETVKVADGSKVVEQTVMDAIIAALQVKFAPSPDILAGLFTAKEKFETKKGLVDKGLALATSGKTPQDAEKLGQFLDIIRCQTQLKPGAKDNE